MLSPEEWGDLEIKSFHSSWSWMSFEAMLEFHKPFASVFTYAVEKLEKNMTVGREKKLTPLLSTYLTKKNK